MSIFIGIILCGLIISMIFVCIFIILSNITWNTIIKENINIINKKYNLKYNRDATKEEILENGIYPTELYLRYFYNNKL